MKKLLIIAGGLAAMSLSMNATAATTLGAGGGPVATGDCSLLSETVTINLSPNVVGAYTCNTSTNIISFAACHPNGRLVGTANYIYNADSNGGAVVADTTTGGCAASVGTVADASARS